MIGKPGSQNFVSGYSRRGNTNECNLTLVKSMRRVTQECVITVTFFKQAFSLEGNQREAISEEIFRGYTNSCHHLATNQDTSFI